MDAEKQDTDDWERDWEIIYGDRWPDVREQWQLDMRDATVSAPSSDLERMLGL